MDTDQLEYDLNQLCHQWMHGKPTTDGVFGTVQAAARVFIFQALDRVVPWRELRPNALLAALARHGVLPLAPGDMAKAFPDIWGKHRTAEKALERAGFRPDISQIDILFGVGRVLISPLATGTYRRGRQRGKPCRVVLYAGLPDPRSALEALIGPLADFQLNVSEPPADTAQPPAPPPPPAGERPLPPLAAALAAEAHLLATGDPSGRPPDMLGFAGVCRLMACAAA